jgi:hypothetical protein
MLKKTHQQHNQSNDTIDTDKVINKRNTALQISHGMHGEK